MRRFGKPSVGAVLFSLLFLSSLPGLTQTLPPEIVAGNNWLRAQIQTDGQLSTEPASEALPMQVRSETATTLKALSIAPPAALYAAIDGITPDTTEYLARKALAKQLAGAADTSALDAMAPMQNTDGGFGAAGGWASNPQDTAWALRALFANRATNAVTSKALVWLISAQQATGQWSLAPDSDNVVVTALVVQALNRYRQQPIAQAALAQARAWLLTQSNANQTWNNDLSNAHALLAVLPGLGSAASVQPAIAALRSTQLSDGSWAGDAHLTALVLRVLWLAAQPFSNPDLASLKGQVVDETTHAPIAGATVTLVNSNLQTNTGTDGSFAFDQLQTQAEQIQIQASGYLTAVGDVILTKGQLTDLGAILMKAMTGGNSTTVTVSGTAYYTNDGTTYYTAPGAVIKAGASSTTSGVGGVYTLNNVPPGLISLQATYSNYPSLAVNFTAQAGQQVRFDPRFVQSTVPNQNTLNVIVTDQVTYNPIAGASVSLNGLVRSSDASGQAKFTTNVLIGSNSVVVAADGYETRVITMTVQGSQAIVLPVMLASRWLEP